MNAADMGSFHLLMSVVILLLKEYDDRCSNTDKVGILQIWWLRVKHFILK